jgi:hypothetical protein
VRHTTLGATHTTPLIVRSRGGGTQLRRRQRKQRRLEEGSSDDDYEEEGSSHEVNTRTRTWRRASSDEE